MIGVSSNGHSNFKHHVKYKREHIMPECNIVLPKEKKKLFDAQFKCHF